jgi:lipopolysaccharide biosynthesis glycosyltransferase
VDNNYAFPLIVLLTSILYNSYKKTFYDFHIMIPFNFLNSNKRKIKFLRRKYPKYIIEFHNFGKKYIDWKRGRYSHTVYYRLSLSNIINSLI